MLKVVLADDEEIIREGIRNAIDWNGLGFEVVGEAEDGEEAIDIVHRTKPDVVITDIKMPFLNGIEFIERIKPDYPELYVIILSGHDEFSYAQRAIKAGAYDYILKPIELNYLSELLDKIRQEKEKEQLKEFEVLTLKENYAENESVMRERFFREIINKKLDKAYVSATLKNLGLDFRGNAFAVLAVQIDDYYKLENEIGNEKLRNLEIKLFDFIKEFGERDNNVVSFESKDGEHVICLSERHKEILKRKIIDYYRKIQEGIELVNKYSATIAVGKIYDSIEELAISFKEAMDALDYKFVIGKNRIIYYENIEKTAKPEFFSLDYNDTDFISLLKTADKKLIDEKLDSIVNDIKTKGSNSYLFMQILIGSIYMQAIRVLKDYGGTVEEVFGDPITVYNNIMSQQTIESLRIELSSLLYSIADYIIVRKTGRYNLTVERAKEYIKKNYNKDSLSLEEVATYVNMSSSYLSVLFKQEEEITFIDYLTHLRIDKAKELLGNTGLKTYEISYMVGYNNPTYFSTTFKKLTGCSPSEYREKI